VATAEISYSGLDALLTPRRASFFSWIIRHFSLPTCTVTSPSLSSTTSSPWRRPQSCLACDILTTVLEERGGYIIKGIQDIFPEQKPINRTFINAWQDTRFAEA